ncbi:MAG: zinc-binding dehydrogenase [Dehalococcoidia bacterium]|nr:zinc-binding dehydrogenase [Dehalococcoidia bacterium]
MKAARLVAPSTFDFIELEEPEPVDGQAKIKVDTVSVCASDIHGTFRAQRPEEDYPMAPGVPCHEIAGTVIESKTDEIEVGQRAIVLPTRGSGGLSEYLVQSPERIIPVPDWGPLDEWVMCQHTGTVLFSAKQWGNAAGKRIAVLGQGGIGLSFTMLAEKQGAQQVIGIDLLDNRLEKALSLGATNTINPDKDQLFEAIDEITGGEGIDVVVDTTGDPEGFVTCLRIVKRWGTFISFSLTGRDGKIAEFPHQEFMFKAATIIPTQVAATSEPTKDIREMVALKERGWIDPGMLKTHNLDFSDVQRAYDMYADRTDGVIKVAMSMNGGN